jgi:predicted transcriptional regulator
MSKGYSIALAEEIKAADQNLIGVRLGRVCLNKNIPVSDVADFFNVSRMTVYSWFKGESLVSSRYAEKMKTLLDKIKK